MALIDTHSHIYLEQFNQDRDEMIQRAFKSGVETILMPNIDVESIDSMLQVENQYPKKCLSMMGLHPTSVKEDYKEQLEQMKSWFDKHKFVGVGEIGIDLYWDKTFLQEQIDAFKIQIDWAKELKLPIVIHAREAFHEIFEVLDSLDLEGITGIFHSFSGDENHAKKIISYNCFKLGINGVVTFKNSKLGEVIKQFSLDHFVLETDAPFLTPAPYRGKRNEPAHLNYVANKFAEIFNVSVEEVHKVTSNNAKELFGI